MLVPTTGYAPVFRGYESRVLLLDDIGMREKIMEG